MFLLLVFVLSSEVENFVRTIVNLERLISISNVGTFKFDLSVKVIVMGS